jgi:hypothetical protein
MSSHHNKWLVVAISFAVLALVSAEPPDTVDGVVSSDDFTANISHRFDVPVQILTSQVLDMAPSDDNQELRVRSIGGDIVTCGATGFDGGSSTCKAPSEASDTDEGHRRPPVRPAPPMPEISDRLVSVDDEPISLLSFQEVIDAPVGTAMILPLFKSVSSANILAGFARVEIFSPTTLNFEPTTPERKQDIIDWFDAMVKYENAERLWQTELDNNSELRENVDRERQEAEDRARKLKELIEAHERAEFERLRMTPHDAVGQKRSEGGEFRYAAEFTEPGPIGINWDLNEADKTIVSHLEPELPADELNVIAPKDQLIELNGVNTSAMGPYEMVELYLQTELPRTLVFLASGKRSKLPDANEPPPPPPRPQNWTLTFDTPMILRDWHIRLHLANWSAIPEQHRSPAMTLALADPIDACSVVRDPRNTNSTAGTESLDVAFLSYRGSCSFMDKAQHVQTAGGRSLVVANNVKGDGRFTPTAVNPDPVDIPVTL